MVNHLMVRFDSSVLSQNEFTEIITKLKFRITVIEYHKRGTSREHMHALISGDWREGEQKLKTLINKHRKKLRVSKDKHQEQYNSRYGINVQYARDIDKCTAYINKEKLEKLISNI